MSTGYDYQLLDEGHPIDLVEELAANNSWDFDRVAPDQIAMQVEGLWRNYAITLAWSDQDQTLRLICTFEMEPPRGRMPQLHDVINRCNDQVWLGCFTYWEEQRLMVWRYGLCLAGGQIAAFEQLDGIISAAVLSCEQYYPAFQIVSWGDKSPEDAMRVAIAEAYGRA